ncbi:MAG: DoxX family protein [Ginsengibacter sp.]
MNKIIATNSNNWTALIARLALALTIFPHGAQKLLGWFGGYGFSGTMGFFTTQVHLPYIIGLMVILIEFFGSLFFIFGFLSRVAAIGFIGIYIGAVAKIHAANGFFMNWNMETAKGEGWEYFILLFALAIIVLVAGGGKASIDAAIGKKRLKTFNGNI